MNREDIIRMAREAGLDPDLWNYTDAFERFAALVASAERESLRESFRVVTAAEASAAILHEREACAKLADEWAVNWPHPAKTIALDIRARGQA